MLLLLSSSLARDARAATFMRVPKTGSTTVLSMLKHSNGVGVVDHADGCRNVQHCNGSTIRNDTVVAALRNPYVRFESQMAHMASKGLSATTILKQARCGADVTPRCLIDEVNRLCKRIHRVILWPQTMWIGASTLVVCVSEDRATTIARWSRLLRALRMDTPVPANVDMNTREYVPNTTSHRRTVDTYYGQDVSLWNAMCA
jgi:ribosomal protein L39E